MLLNNKFLNHEQPNIVRISATALTFKMLKLFLMTIAFLKILINYLNLNVIVKEKSDFTIPSAAWEN